MGKPKKGKKGKQEEDFSDGEGDIDLLAQSAAGDEGEDDVVNKPVAKKGKKARRKKDDWEDDAADELAKLSINQSTEANHANGDTEEKLKGKQKKKKGKKVVESESEEDEEMDEDIGNTGSKKNKMSAFMMLDMDSGGDSGSGSEDEEVAPEPVKVEPMPKKKEEPKPEPKKGKQKPGKKGKKDDEDIDAILAEFAPEKKEGKEKKGKKNDQEASVDEGAKVEPVKSEAKETKAETTQPVEEASGDNYIDIANMTQEQIARMLGDDDMDDEYEKKKKKKKKGKKEAEPAAMGETKERNEPEEEDGFRMKTAAEKKKEKKERQKQKKSQEKDKAKKTEEAEKPRERSETPGEVDVEKDAPAPAIKDAVAVEDAATAAEAAAPTDKPAEEDEAEDKAMEEAQDDSKGKKKKKKDKKGKEEKEKEEKKKKPSKMVLLIQEQQRKIKEAEEQAKKEEEDKERRFEEARLAKEEAERLEKERKEKLKERNKQKIAQAKAEGRYLTPKQKEAQRKAQMMIEAMKAKGIPVPQKTDGAVPEVAEKKRRGLVYDRKKKKPQDKQNKEQPESPVLEEGKIEEVAEEPSSREDSEEKEEEMKEQEQKKEESEEEDVKDAWDLSEEEEEEPAPPIKQKEVEIKPDQKIERNESIEDESGEDESSEESSEEETESESEEETSSDEDDGLTVAERAREKAINRIKKRKEKNEETRTTDELRAPVVCVLGHVDTGKTKILDKLRRTNVQDGEAGGITQQIGATNVPGETIQEQTKMCKEFSKKELKVPGLLIIDTPGHESFSNLRSRGSSLCDIAILVVDIMHGLEPQTIESINLLKQRKCPFVVALNKVDRLYGWQANPHNDVINTLKRQKPNTRVEFDERAKSVMVQFSEQGLNAALFYENKNPKEYISMVPTSAHSGDGMGNLMALICELTQSFLVSRISYTDELHATVMEVKEIHGLGTTIDVILVNGVIREGNTIVLAGTEGPIVTQVRGLLMPKPLKELRVKGSYDHVKELHAAQGVKVIAKDLEKALAGLPLHIAHYPDEVELLKEEVESQLEDVLDSIKTVPIGVFVQASTLGSLEALLQFLKDSKIPYAGINIGPVHKRDIMKASAMIERDSQWAVILAFDVKIEREAQEMADETGVKIFTADIIYHLFDNFTAYRDELKKKKQEEFKHIAVFPTKLRILPQYVFNSRDPIVVGVIVEAGFIKVGTPLCVPSKEFVDIGRVVSLELNHKQVNKALKGSEVCVKIDSLPGEAPKMFGRHFDETDLLISKISRESIDAVKNYFREDMGKTDWGLMVELKKLFEII